MSRSQPSLLVALLASLLAASCDDGGGGVFYPDVGPPDGGGDADDLDGGADAGCRFDTQCDDGIDCTADTCERSTGLCDHRPDHESCHDALRCNGYEFCDAMLGCQPGIPNQDCNDGIACTIDLCIEPERPELPVACEYRAMDRDGDGHVDNHCAVDPVGDPEGPRGDDCDDLDADRFPGAGEFCFDGRDNDCDLDIDSLDDDCLLWNDTCGGAIELVPGRLREGFTIGAGAETDMSCGWTSYQDVVYFFSVDEPADVTLEVWGRDYFYPIVAVQTVCGDLASEVRCISGSTEARFFGRGMEAGTYYVVVESWSEGVFDVLLSVEPVTEPPEGETCEDPIALTPGVPTSVDLGEFESDVPITCASGDSYPDAVFAFALGEPHDVRYEVEGAGITPYVGVRTICDEMASESSCEAGNPLGRTLCALPAGTHFMVVRGSRGGEVDLEVTLADPSSPPPNDDCAGAIDVSAGGTFHGTLLCSSGDTDLSCDYWGEHDVLYTFTTTTAQDVSLRLSPEDGLWASLALTTSCGVRTPEVFCLRDDRPERLIRALPPGTYTIVVAGEYAAAFDLDVEISTPTSACDGATVLTESTVVTGDTAGRGNSLSATCGGLAAGADIPYVLEVPYPFRLRAEVTDAAYDTVLHLRSSCDDPASEIECDDDDGTDALSLIDRPGLAAGSYVLVMDGFFAGAEGPFTLDVEIAPTDPCDAPAAGGSPLSGDTCAAGSTAGVHAGSCGGAGATEAVHRIEVAAPSDLHAEVTSAAFDALLYLRGDCGDSGTELACDHGTPSPALDAPGLAAGTYYLVVDGGSAGACGTYAVDVTLTPH